jgi:hypothetical protein
MQESLVSNRSSDRLNSYPGLFPTCKARTLTHSSDYAECIGDALCNCQYRHAFAWSSRCYCHHPNWPEIVADTDNEKLEGTSG